MTGISFSQLLVLFTFLILTWQSRPAQTHNVLVLCPVATRSHKNILAAVYTGLADRSHNITVVSAWPSEPHPNVRDIIPFEGFDLYPNISVVDVRRVGAIGSLRLDISHTVEKCNSVYDSAEFMALLKQDFQLVLIDITFNECLLGLVYKLGAPYIISSPCGIPNFGSYLLGSHLPPSFVPNALTTFDHRMSLFERTVNSMVNLAMVWSYEAFMPGHERVYKRRLGQDLPSIGEIRRNASMAFSNSHISYHFPRPLLPDIVEIGGAHCRPGKLIAPKELRDFVDGATDGLILFSLGSLLRSHDMPEESRRVFVNTFGRLKQRVLWKWDGDMTDLPANVKISKWLPQQDVLAHPNTKLFITHAGLLSTQESIFHEVPMIAIPFITDQDPNAHRSAALGISITVEFIGLTEDTLKAAIHQVLSNQSYRANIKQVSSYFRDQPQNPKDRAVFWAEYVMRHRGARHMRSAARDLNFWQYYCIDVAVVMIAVLAAVVAAILLILRKIWLRSLQCMPSSEDTKSPAKKNQ